MVLPRTGAERAAEDGEGTVGLKPSTLNNDYHQSFFCGSRTGGDEKDDNRAACCHLG